MTKQNQNSEDSVNQTYFINDFLTQNKRQIIIAFIASVVSQLIICEFYARVPSSRLGLVSWESFAWLVLTALTFALWFGRDISALEISWKFDNLSYFFVFTFFSMLLNGLSLLLDTSPTTPLAVLQFVLSLGGVLVLGASFDWETENKAQAKQHPKLYLVAAIMLYLGQSLFPSVIR